MTDSFQLASLFGHQLLAATRSKVASRVEGKTSLKLLLLDPIGHSYLTESSVRRSVSNMDFESDDNGPITIQDLDVRSYKVKIPFGGVATHTTAVVMLVDSERRSLPIKVTLSSEFAGFEVQVGR